MQISLSNYLRANSNFINATNDDTDIPNTHTLKRTHTHTHTQTHRDRQRERETREQTDKEWVICWRHLTSDISHCHHVICINKYSSLEALRLSHFCYVSNICADVNTPCDLSTNRFELRERNKTKADSVQTQHQSSTSDSYLVNKSLKISPTTKHLRYTSENIILLATDVLFTSDKNKLAN